jgi:hypothetical protein
MSSVVSAVNLADARVDWNQFALFLDATGLDSEHEAGLCGWLELLDRELRAGNYCAPRYWRLLEEQLRRPIVPGDQFRLDRMVAVDALLYHFKERIAFEARERMLQ